MGDEVDGKATHIRVEDVRFYVRDVRTRMPFRYGKATITRAPILHVVVDLVSESGGRSSGVAADILPPKWFDKDPARDFRRNVEDLLTGAREAARFYQETTSGRFLAPFVLWHEALETLADRGARAGLNRLTASHGPSLLDRAIIDSLGTSDGLSFQELLVSGRLGFLPARVHPELRAVAWQAVFGSPPPRSLFIRHTVGLADPLRESDIAGADRLDDGLPQSLESYVRAQELRYFKIKVGGEARGDVARLVAIAGLLDETIREPYVVTLDGNEQFADTGSFVSFVDTLRGQTRLGRFVRSISYVEQPFPRHLSLDEATGGSPRLAGLGIPVTIDEADDHLGAFRRAVELGYRGVSSKSCKGIYKSLLNRLVVEHLNRGGAAPYFMTGEDLMNAPVVPLHQDTVLLGVLGILHAERNGHHYLRGLDHLSPLEREACLEHHPGLYERWSGGARLAVRGGRIDTRSLQTTGLGVGVPTDFSSMVPLESWSFGSDEGLSNDLS